MDARPREAGMRDVMLENMRLENVRLSQRIEALKAAGKRLADAVEACDEEDLDSEESYDASANAHVALAAWRAAEKEACG